MNPDLIWHYTIKNWWKDISHTGVILPAYEGIKDYERPIVWFSTNQYWERTVTKGCLVGDSYLDLDMEGMLSRGIALVRIGVTPEVAPHHWATIKRRTRISVKNARLLAVKAAKVGADPMEWRGTLEPVLAASWSRVEFFENGEWVSQVF